MEKSIVVGITGASGAIYGIRLLEALGRSGIRTHLVISRAAETTLAIETGKTPDEVRALAHECHEPGDLAASIASGSRLTLGMAVVPCTIKTLSAVANSYADNLISRAADVTLKEGRKLVLAVRETPLHAGHLELMSRAAASGAVILPPVPAFYHRPETIEDLVDQTVGKILDQFGISHGLFRRWGD